MTDCIQVLTTTASQDEAARIARTLVEGRLAACVQVLGPITSTYRWQGAIETSQEWLCIAKTLKGLYPEVEQAIRQAHSYQVPEILAVAVAAASADYLAWLAGEVKDA
jgi:periplasmic divalent cation tolerance protein